MHATQLIVVNGYEFSKLDSQLVRKITSIEENTNQLFVSKFIHFFKFLLL
jgi:hypothetical protein